MLLFLLDQFGQNQTRTSDGEGEGRGRLYSRNQKYNSINCLCGDLPQITQKQLQTQSFDSSTVWTHMFSYVLTNFVKKISRFRKFALLGKHSQQILTFLSIVVAK